MKDHNIDPALVEDPYPLQAHLGFYITEWRKDFARFELPMEHFLMNRYGILHGGIHAMLADSAMGYCGSFTGDPDNKAFAMTLNLSVNYMGRTEGKLLIAEAHVTGGGAKTFFAESVVKDELDNIAARATGVFRRRGS